jgi:hypothetical protein
MYNIMSVPKEVQDQITLELKILTPLLATPLPTIESTNLEIVDNSSFPGAPTKPDFYSHYKAKS